ncbi:hypothetical protein [Halorhabdus amylolytica]|uniref:hypothetical protein n=1 Tax=Halorhabdus amylolytica TaxID=2559573 RepID=UPI0010AA1E55|nr:hypothetical protein [Halorhabdus amylolytica]
MSEDSTSTGGNETVSMGIAGTEPAERRGRRILQILLENDVLLGEAEVTVAEEFHREWRDRMAALRGRTLSAEIEETYPGVDAERTEYRGTPYYALEERTGGVEADRMVSHVLAVADVASVRTLEDTGVPSETARLAARSLRQFLSSCPVCANELVTMNESCCGGHGPRGPTKVLACQHCKVPIYVFEE